jgi:TATA-box binding protein (TBP) (component of TFIID and TFIIIB)
VQIIIFKSNKFILTGEKCVYDDILKITYTLTLNKGILLTVDRSKQDKDIQALLKQEAELKRIIGLQQMEIDFQNKRKEIMDAMIADASNKKN